MNVRTMLSNHIKAMNFQAEIDKAETQCNVLRAANTVKAKTFMDTLHGTHMAPGKFKR